RVPAPAQVLTHAESLQLPTAQFPSWEPRGVAAVLTAVIEAVKLRRTDMTTKATALLAALALGFAVKGAQAGGKAAGEDATLSNAKVSLTQAIGIAEKEGSGQAISADYMGKKGSMGHYDIKVLSSDGAKLTKYRVSPSTGKISQASNEAFEKVFTRIKPA